MDPQNVLIRNVYLLEGSDVTTGVLVNLLIKNNTLEIVSQDEIPASENLMVVDGRNGYLLGQLNIGESPSFIILNQDPREDFSVLADTNSFTIFGVHNGELLANNLFEVEEKEESKAPKQHSWTAYTPPPIALPLSYRDTTPWNAWDGQKISGVLAAGVFLDRMRWLSQDDAGIGEVGDLKEFNGGEIRGFRIGAVGTINFETPWTYTLFAATNAFDKGFDSKDTDDITLFDYRLDIPVFNGKTLSIGKQKEPISMDRLMVGTHVQMQERPAFLDAMLPSRNFGALLSGMAADERMTWAAGVFNDWIDTGDSFGESSSQVVGRVTWLPYISEDESNLVHLGLGMRYTNAEEGVHFHTEPEFNQSPEFVDTSNFAADSAMTYNLEASWRKGPFWLGGEFMTTDVNSPASGDPTFSGYHITGSWALTGEMRPYRRRGGIMGNTPVSRSVYQDGWGSLELAVRWSELDLTDGLIDGGELEILSLGINWSLTSAFVLGINYRHISTDRAGVSWDSDGFNTRLILLLE